MNTVSNVAKAVGQKTPGFEKLEKCQGSSKSIALKLTAECNKAIQKAIEIGWPVRIVSAETDVTIEVGNSINSVCTFTSKQQRLNVNGTEKSFSGTRDKVVKLAELQSQQQTKTELTKTSANNKKRTVTPFESGSDRSFAIPEEPAVKRFKQTSQNVRTSKTDVNCDKNQSSTKKLVDRSAQNVVKETTENPDADSDDNPESVNTDGKSTTMNSDVKHDWANLYARPKSCCLTSEIPYLIDWLETFPEVKDAKTCALYTELFESAYPTYGGAANQKLAAVYQEFVQLQKIYKYAELEDKYKANQTLQELHDKYDADVEFYKLRKEHLTLHLKLEALRRRIEEWNEKQ
ncbi:unnamed protein product [Bursaphelenchus okinawaensis]|uniref:OCEL domain-containing protein n=1 Tax=Bursaphelenchus okinawaensis TaxID=465554 RepID=A0A811KMS5_9BILA|nr:unnamed protein product [Bursaphelenchus okinawaensis]CAG9106334.1 unnamed protein product [Bursaphelenchus okinawaensis]